MIKYFLLILIKPGKTIRQIIQSNIRLSKIIFFLFWLGVIRGVLEVIWIFAINHRLMEMPLLLRQLSWWYLESGPFILANILTVYFRWAMYSLVFYLLLRFFKIKMDFSKVLKVFSVILVLYVITMLTNFLHYFFRLDMIRFYISELYSYSMGIGQIISSCLLILLIYNLALYFGLDRISSLLSSLLVFSAERIFYFFSAWVYFRLPMINALSYKKIFNLGNCLSSLVSLLLTILFLWLGYKLNAQRKANI